MQSPASPSLSCLWLQLLEVSRDRRKREAIELKSHSQQKEAKGGSSHVCIEMPSQFILTLLKCANSPQRALVSSYGDRDMQQHEFCVADYP